MPTVEVMETMSHPEAIAQLGPEPQGDVAGMRRLAEEVRLVASGLREIGRVQLTHWESERARRTKARIEDAASTADTAAGDLLGVAALLEREADDLAVRQRRWAARYAELTGRCPT